VRICLCRSFVLAAAFGLLACDADPKQPGSTSTSSGDDTGGDDGPIEGCVPPQSELLVCASDGVCGLAGDCCGCSAYRTTSIDPPNCGGSCAMDKCEEWGISEVTCNEGHCAAVGLSCNQALVTCKVAPPVCDVGFLPQVWDHCFTGACLPVEACDWVPDCSACAEGELCMHELRGGCDYVRCVAEMAECQGESACCVGESWCEPASCTVTADGFACGDQG
jgi:hypothetical protein